MNIQFNYLYRDGSNYKNYGSVIFSNPTDIAIEIIESTIRKNLIDGGFFIASNLNLPELFFNPINDDDHHWHEFESVELSEHNTTSNQTIQNFLQLLKKE